ncbi:TPA: ash family protein [Yersinia enterocolitica]|nr:ash family protein [Yersinia enterocolitica]HDL7734518.1 ash family protein [Yersinia enterocolitica]HDL7837755.1 ash family protein [Yersinia enterocolitica]HDL8286704.1 ash family protein [Yersinia enterocolitica]HDL8434343.1 ash family protein [Yersinia enterocolitica]
MGYSHAAAAKSAVGFGTPEITKAHDRRHGYYVRAQ